MARSSAVSARDRVGYAEAAARARSGRREDRRDDLPVLVDHRPAGVAGAHRAAQRRDRAPHRPLAVGVLRDHLARAARSGPRARRRARCRGSRGSPPRCRTSACRPASARPRPDPGTRSTARSFVGRTTTASASSPGWRPRSSTRVSFCPATTCALVTTSPGAGDPAGALDAQPARVAEDLDHRVRRGDARPRARAIPAVGAGTRASGPSMRGNGSSRASASISPLDGGSAALRCCRIVERWTSRRASPPLASASAPSTQVIPSPTQAVRTAPSSPSTAVAAGDRTRPRKRAPTPSKPSAKTMPAISAPTRPKAGDQGDRRPSSSSSGPSRVPDVARPPRTPAARARPATNPCAQPNSASSRTTPTISQSMPVTSSERTGGHVQSQSLTSSTPRPRRRRPARDRQPSPLRPARGRGARRARGRASSSGAGHVPAERRTVAAFAAAWERGDQRAMYALLSDDARRRTTPARLRAHLPAGGRDPDARARPRRAGRSDETTRPDHARDAHLRHPAAARSSSPRASARTPAPGVDWRAELVYPGLRRGEKLKRETSLPPRATIQARDGTRAGQGPGPRVRPRTARVRDRRARSAPRPRSARPSSQARGVPAGAAVGLTGLEREFDERLTGTPGGILFAGDRVLANRKAGAGPLGAHDDRPEDPARRGRGARRPLRRDRGRRARATARCSRWPGSPSRRRSRPARRSRSSRSPACSRTRSPSARDLPGPDRGDDRGRRDPERQRRVLRRLAARSPSRTPATASSRRWARSSARRSSSTTAAEVRLQRGAAAVRRGALDDPRRRARSATTSPSARPRSARARCSPRRCRWRSSAATIGADGVRPQPTLLKGADPQRVRVTSDVASPARSRATCAPSSPTAPAAPRRSTASRSRARPAPPSCARRSRRSRRPRSPTPTQPPPEDDTTDTDAWFAAFAPYSEPRIAVAVLLVGQGTGGDTAAPAAGARRSRPALRAD